MSLGEDVMDRREIVAMCMESPLYFTMPVKMRLEFVRRERLYPSDELRKDIISWLKTGDFDLLGHRILK
jgi:hypothetical protein